MHLYIWMSSLVSHHWLKPIILYLCMVYPLTLLYVLDSTCTHFSTFAIFIDLANNLRIVLPAHRFKIRVVI